jgi:pimeloyl-ACP methyl ester carboxylesterase
VKRLENNGVIIRSRKETQKKIPNSKLVEIPNIRHMPHIESFDKFIQPLADFLERNSK